MNKKDLRTFGVGLAIILCIIAIFQLLKGNIKIALCFFGSSGLILAFTFFVPKALTPIYRFFTTVSYYIGWINTRILLGIVFYFIFSPIGIFLRIIRKDPLNRKFDKAMDSYWQSKEQTVLFDKTRYEKQF